MTFDEWWQSLTPRVRALISEVRWRACWDAAQAAQREAGAMWLRNWAAESRKAGGGKERLDGNDVAEVLEDCAAMIRVAKETT